jgi:GNAT superfamily N-acetyltransferase
MPVLMPPTIRPATHAEAQTVASHLHEFNVARMGPTVFQPFALSALEGGELVGGILAQTVIDWLQIDILWVAEDRRGAGIGGALLEHAEAEAQRRGCRRALLDTFDWQAEPFYRKHGYEVFGRLEDCPSPGHVRMYLRKTLAQPPRLA